MIVPSILNSFCKGLGAIKPVLGTVMILRVPSRRFQSKNHMKSHPFWPSAAAWPRVLFFGK